MTISFYSKNIFLTLIFIFLSITSSISQVTYTGKEKIISIGNSIEYYIDYSASQNIQSIQNQTHFLKFKQTVPNMGLLKVPLWLKIKITNKSSARELMIEFDQSFFRRITFFYRTNGKLNINNSGELYPFNSRANNYHKFLYDVNISKDSTATFYARIVSTHEIQLPVFLGKKDYLENDNLVKNIFFGIFFGIVLVMFFYNLFIYFVVKDFIYLYYVIYIFVLGLTQATIEGYCFQYLWPDSSFLATRSFFLLTALVNITGLEFVRKFLQTKVFIVRLDKIAYFLYFVYFIDIIITLKGNLYLSYQILQSFAGLVSLYILTISIIIAARGYRPAKFFIIAWLPLIAGIIIWILQDFNVLAYTKLTNYSITIGSALEVILLSFALADKINIFKAEKEKSQEETLQALKENERIIREQNVVLELKVNERTHELKETNEELNRTLDDLKQAQIQLVESEKMASLGQLTAGIAHEINNPINFVTGNIKPLKRNIDMMMEALTVIENVGISDSSQADKKHAISEYKEEIDFDYLTMETAQLMKGIKEGATRTAEIVKSLKIFSRLDEDDIKRADINEGLESTMVIANNLLNGKINVIKQYGDLPLVECYAGKLNQVFLNIITNAIYAVQKQFGDKPGGEIVLNTTCDEHNVYIKIKDNGTGMDANTRKKIYEPFFTTKDVGEGTGLGMSIAYNTIKKHNGQILLSSTPGEGTTFTLEIPQVFNAKLIEASMAGD